MVQKPKYGFESGFMALDVAALQHVYELMKNSEAKIIYIICQIKTLRNLWQCIWDTGGIDEISAKNLQVGCEINLNEASLLALMQEVIYLFGRD